MSIRINVTGTVPFESTIEVTERVLDMMVGQGVDVTDEQAVADFYARHAGKEVGGCYLMSTSDIADNWNTRHQVEIDDWSGEGEAPERFWNADRDGEVRS